jgi:hypothetical protein
MHARLGDFGLSRLLAPPDACYTGTARELVCCTVPQGAMERRKIGTRAARKAGRRAGGRARGDS